jgi:glycosyltransferase involved in cell wall biosynthesis
MADSVHRVLLLDGELSFRGSSLLTLRLARGLERREIDTALVCTTVGPLDSTLLKGVRLHRVPGYTMPVWGPLVMRTLWRDMKRELPDVIHLQDSRLLPQGNWLAERFQRPIVVTVSDHSEAAALNLKQASPWLRAIVSVSESVQSQIPPHTRLGEIEQRVILPGVAVPEGASIRAPLEGAREPVVGMAGPLEIIKGASFFLRACHRVVEAGHDIGIIVAGSGPEERSLRQLASSLELTPRLTFVDGGVSMKAYLSAMDIFCLPSLQQGLGVMMLEAMALGRPVIASGVGGVLSVIEDGRTGLIVPPSDSRSLAERMIELLTNPDLARRLGEAGRQRIHDQFNEQRMLNDVIQLYNEVNTAVGRRSVTIPMTAAPRGS